MGNIILMKGGFMENTCGFDVGGRGDINVNINCTFGEGPDVALDITAPIDRLENTHSRGFIPIDLTFDEAIAIGSALIEAASDAKRLSEVKY